MGFTKPAFLKHRQTNKKKIVPTAVPTLMPNKQISTPRKTSEIKAKQKEKEEVKLRDWVRIARI